MYQKRHARHYQKKLSAERLGKKVTQRTLNAIENNAQWVRHYQQLLRPHTARRRKEKAPIEVIAE